MGAQEKRYVRLLVLYLLGLQLLHTRMYTPLSWSSTCDKRTNIAAAPTDLSALHWCLHGDRARPLGMLDGSCPAARVRLPLFLLSFECAVRAALERGKTA